MAQLVKWSFPTSEIRGWNSVIGNFYLTTVNITKNDKENAGLAKSKTFSPQLMELPNLGNNFIHY